MLLPKPKMPSLPITRGHQQRLLRDRYWERAKQPGLSSVQNWEQATPALHTELWVRQLRVGNARHPKEEQRVQNICGGEDL